MSMGFSGGTGTKSTANTQLTLEHVSSLPLYTVTHDRYKAAFTESPLPSDMHVHVHLCTVDKHGGPRAPGLVDEDTAG